MPEAPLRTARAKPIWAATESGAPGAPCSCAVSRRTLMIRRCTTWLPIHIRRHVSTDGNNQADLCLPALAAAIARR